jgi:tetratricopeptide (TPR) repeat protein/transcriptional regulator with XRE-family HTH domain
VNPEDMGVSPERIVPVSHSTIGPLLRELRRGTGRSQAQQADILAQLSGRPVTRNEVSRWESQARLPTPHWQRHIAESFDIKITELTLAVAASRIQRRGGRVEVGIESDPVSGHHDVDIQGTLSQQAADNSQILGRMDVEVVREMASTFRRLDNRFGGGHSRFLLENYLSTNVEEALRHGRIGDGAVRRGFIVAAAELYQVAGWMAYDTADMRSGRRLLQKALRLAQDVESAPLVAEILAAMSHQASFNGSADAAVELALASGDSARRAGQSKIQAEAAAMEAHGLGLQGDTRGCLAALQKAERFFHAPSGGDCPEWLSYFDEAYLAAKFGHALRDLRQPRDAEKFARSSLEMSDGYDRARVFNMALLAGVLADQGKVEEAVAYTHKAVALSDGMRSARTTFYIRDVFQRLKSFKDSSQVANLRIQLESARILPVRPV